MKRKILIIDDDMATTRMVKIGLERTGNFEVRDENSGRRGLSAARAFQPDLILLDLCMPEFDGSDVARQLRGDALVGNTPIVFFTSLASEHDSSNTQLSGSRVLAKTTNPEKIIACINKVLPL